MASLPAMTRMSELYFAGAVALSLITKIVDQFSNGQLPPGGPWPGSITASMSHWMRFALAYAFSATAGLWIGVQTGSIRAVWISAIVLVFLLPDLRVTYTRIFEGMIGTMLAVLTVGALTLAGPSPAVLAGIILLFALVLPSQLLHFWLFSGLIAAIVLIAWSLASSDPAIESLLLWERLEDTLIAAVLVAAVTLLFFPRESWSSLVGLFGASRQGR
jgi:uncharacterized membrane protein YccC